MGFVRQDRLGEHTGFKKDAEIPKKGVVGDITNEWRKGRRSICRVKVAP